MSKDAGAAAFRKTWDKEAAEKRAKARLEEEREANIQAPQPIVQRAPLQRREVDLQLTKYVNTRQMVTLGQATNGEMSGVYYCSVCQCHLRDSANYLLHINGKKHNRMLGMSMRAERATLGEVRPRQPLRARCPCVRLERCASLLFRPVCTPMLGSAPPKPSPAAPEP